MMGHIVGLSEPYELDRGEYEDLRSVEAEVEWTRIRKPNWPPVMTRIGFQLHWAAMAAGDWVFNEAGE